MLISIQDDIQSLVELHQYLNSGPEEDAHPTSPVLDRQQSTSSSIKSARRRSLPMRNSMSSLHSEYSLTSPNPEVTEFQLRRRRAAKLTQFFGVDYRLIIHDVLESIQSGVEEERKRGTLNPHEFEVCHRSAE